MKPSIRPDLSHSSRELAGDNARVARFVDSLTERMDHVLMAAQQADWEAVRRLGDGLARCSRKNGLPQLATAADEMCRQIDRTGDEAAVKSSMIRLVGACGRLREPAAE